MKWFNVNFNIDNGEEALERLWEIVKDFLVIGVLIAIIIICFKFISKAPDIILRWRKVWRELRKSRHKSAKQLTKGPVRVIDNLRFRDRMVKKLSRKIRKSRKTKNNKFLIHGFGGMGKTAVAAALYENLESEFQEIGWVECREKSSLRDSLLAAVDTGKGKKTDEERFAKIEKRLMNATEQTILFLDNVDRTDQLLTELTRYRVTLVVTSRMEQMAGYIPISVPQLNTNQCVKLFCDYYRGSVSRKDRPVVRELVRLVSCHTLAVELLAKGVPAGMGLAEYLKRLRAEGFGFPKLTFSTDHDQTERTVVEHLKKLFDMARLDEEQTRVMQNLALMADSRTLPFAVREWIGCDENTLAALVRTGWLTRTGEGYEVHPIVREIVLLDPVPEAAVEHFFQYVENDTQDREDYLTSKNFLETVKSALDQLGKYSAKGQDTSEPSDNQGNSAADQESNIPKGNNLKKELLRNLDTSDPNQTNTAADYYEQGDKYYNIGKYDAAETFYQKAVEVRLGASPTAETYFQLGDFYERQGKYAKAKEMYDKAAKIWKGEKD